MNPKFKFDGFKPTLEIIGSGSSLNLFKFKIDGFMLSVINNGNLLS